MIALAQSVRTLVHRPLLTLTAILSLGLGVGASTAIFSLLDTVALRPLPYRHADQLVELGSAVPIRSTSPRPPGFWARSPFWPVCCRRRRRRGSIRR